METNYLFTKLFFIFIALVCLERFWWTFMRDMEKEKGEIQKKWTLNLMNISYCVVIIGVIIEYISVERSINFLISFLGICIFFIAFWLRRLCSRTLGKFQSLQIEIRNEHPFIKNGPYKYIRHPWYLAIILELVSISLVCNTFYMLCYVLFIHIPVLLVRIYYEEKALIEKFGDSYIEYKREVKALIPF